MGILEDNRVVMVWWQGLQGDPPVVDLMDNEGSQAKVLPLLLVDYDRDLHYLTTS